MPRLKAIASQKLYRPVTGRPDDYPNLTPILTRPIQWELIRQQYDEMVKYATALRLGTADADTILKRFTRDNLQHPTSQALVELGKAIKTTFLLTVRSFWKFIFKNWKFSFEEQRTSNDVSISLWTTTRLADERP